MTSGFVIRQLRIALVLSELRPGGMERLVVHLAIELTRRQIPVEVICLQSPGKLALLLHESNVPVVALESHGGKDIVALWRLRQQLIQFRANIIHLNDYTSLPYASLTNFLTFKSIPMVFTAHGLLYEGFEPLQKRLRFFSRFLTGISAVSKKVARRHQDYLHWHKPMEVIANGVPAIVPNEADRVRIREELNCQDNTHLFLAVGNPRPEKGFEDLLAAAALFRQQRENFLIVIAGTLTESQYCRNLQAQLKSLDIEGHCKFLGFRDDTVALYSAADTFVLSSRSEGLPMVILEAMTAGLPVIATRVGGIPDAVGANVFLVDSENPPQLAEAMNQLMSDDRLRNDLATKGKDHVETNFGVERMVDEYVEWYNQVLSVE